MVVIANQLQTAGFHTLLTCNCSIELTKDDIRKSVKTLNSAVSLTATVDVLRTEQPFHAAFEKQPTYTPNTMKRFCRFTPARHPPLHTPFRCFFPRARLLFSQIFNETGWLRRSVYSFFQKPFVWVSRVLILSYFFFSGSRRSPIHSLMIFILLAHFKICSGWMHCTYS